MVKIVSIVGARPQFIKLAPFLRSVEIHNKNNDSQIRHITIHTGQHYDRGLSDIFFEELEIPPAQYNLGVGSGSHGKQTGQMLERIETVLVEEKPEVVVVFGDTNSTVAGALAAAKLHIPIAHVEAGLRSFNRVMPEEINRVIADHVSDLLLAPTDTAVKNLTNEGLKNKTVRTGDIMYDTVLLNKELAKQKSTILAKMSLEPMSYYLVTIHRAENTNDPLLLQRLLETLNQIGSVNYPVIFPIHPRTKNLIAKNLPDWSAHPSVKLIDPVGYLDMLMLISHARIVMTDSGGLQKEVFFLNRPCITLRKETEWVETVEAEANILTGPNPDRIISARALWEEKISHKKIDFSHKINKYYGNGESSTQTLNAILNL